MSPFLILGCGVFIVLGGILALRWHPFLALILGALAVAILTPSEALQKHAAARVAKGEWSVAAAEKWRAKPPPTRVAEELGRTCVNLGILIAMATIIGEAMMLSGAAATLAERLLRWTGQQRAHWAFFFASFGLCIPVMLDTVMYLLAPLFREIGRRKPQDYLLLVLCTVAGGTITHSLVPPTPGPLFVAGELDVPLGLMIGMGTLVGLGAALAGVAYATWCNRRHPVGFPAGVATETNDPDDANDTLSQRRTSLWLALLPVVLPVFLIGLAAVWGSVDSKGKNGSSMGLVQVLQFFGDKDLALTLGALAALAPLAFCKEKGLATTAVQRALSSGGVILLLIAAGGAFGGVLQQTGIGAALASNLSGSGGWALPLVFLITAMVRTAQGSATVAMITAAPIAKAFMADGAGTHPVYLALAIGCGSKPVPWMNDAGFWIISRLSGLTEAQTLRTVSPMMSLQGVVGLGLTLLLAWLFPLR